MEDAHLGAAPRPSVWLGAQLMDHGRLWVASEGFSLHRWRRLVQMSSLSQVPADWHVPWWHRSPRIEIPWSFLGTSPIDFDADHLRRRWHHRTRLELGRVIRLDSNLAWIRELFVWLVVFINCYRTKRKLLSNSYCWNDQAIKLALAPVNWPTKFEQNRQPHFLEFAVASLLKVGGTAVLILI